MSASPPGSAKTHRERREAILQVLASDPARAWTARDVHARAMRHGTLEQVHDAINRLCRTGDIEAVHRAGRRTGAESTFRAASAERVQYE